MAGQLMLLFKDEKCSAEDFDHLADVVIFNQHFVNNKVYPYKIIEIEANTEEMQKMAWMAQFASIDILYILDRDLETRSRFLEVKQSFGGMLKFVDIILVQIDDRIYPVKAEVMMRTILRFACSNTDPLSAVTDNITQISDILAIAQEQRESLLQKRGMTCENCGFSQSHLALDLYKHNYTGNDQGLRQSSGVSRIEMIRFGALRPFEDILEDMKKGIVLCRNCAVILDEQNKE